jgi:predicted transcriptional regulator
MGEGVDPTQMCQNLVQKVAQAKQLLAITDSRILLLFENWLDELEDAAVAYLKGNPAVDAAELAENLGLSRSGADFLVAKLQREQKM